MEEKISDAFPVNQIPEDPTTKVERLDKEAKDFLKLKVRKSYSYDNSQREGISSEEDAKFNTVSPPN